jgi:hypothetical protein
MATRQTYFEKIPLDEIKALIAKKGKTKPKTPARVSAKRRDYPCVIPTAMRKTTRPRISKGKIQ